MYLSELSSLSLSGVVLALKTLARHAPTVRKTASRKSTSSFNAELEHAAEQLNATALLGASIDTPATSAVLEETWTATLHTTAEEPACVCPRCDDDAVTAVTPTPSSAPTAAWLARLPSSAPSAAWLNASSPPQIVASNTPADDDAAFSEVVLPDGTKRRSLGSRTVDGVPEPLPAACSPQLAESTAALRALVDGAHSQ